MGSHKQAAAGSGTRSAWWYGDRNGIDGGVECIGPGGRPVRGGAKISRHALAAWLDEDNASRAPSHGAAKHAGIEVHDDGSRKKCTVCGCEDFLSVRSEGLPDQPIVLVQCEDCGAQYSTGMLPWLQLPRLVHNGRRQ